MRTAIAALLIAASLTTASAQPIGGRYQVIGKSLEGTNYFGTAEIVITSNTTCRITWITGGSTARGICMRNGSIFAATYRQGNYLGLLIYELKPDGSLDGLWTVADKSGVGSEVLIPMK